MGMSATRNRAKGEKAGDWESACDAAGVAWGMSYAAIERIWRTRPAASDCNLGKESDAPLPPFG